MIVKTFLFALSCFNVMGQAVYDMVDPGNQNANLLYGKVSDAKKPHYLMEYFNTGAVKLSTGATLINIKINYDPFTDNLVTKLGEKDFIIDRTSVAEFSFYDVKASTSYNFFKLTENERTFYVEQLLVCPSFILYKQNIRHLRESAPDMGYGSDSFKDKNSFTDQSTFFLKTHAKLLLIDRKNSELEEFLRSIDSGNEQWQKLNKLKTNSSNQKAVVSYFALLCK